MVFGEVDVFLSNVDVIVEMVGGMENFELVVFDVDLVFVGD